MVTEKTWEEFRECGLLWWINTTLHMFGWAIVYEFNEDRSISKVYPARVAFRGFGGKQIEEGYQKVSKYLVDNAKRKHGLINKEKLNDKFNQKYCKENWV